VSAPYPLGSNIRHDGRVWQVAFVHENGDVDAVRLDGNGDVERGSHKRIPLSEITAPERNPQ